MTIRTLVWGENVHEQKNKVVAENYPNGMHNQIASLIKQDPAEGSIKSKRFNAALDTNYLSRVLQGFAEN